MAESLDMTVDIAGLRLKNPILAASGTFGYGLEFASILDLNELGGFVTKGLSREPMAGNPAPRLIETPAGLMNSIGLQNIGVKAFLRDKLPRLSQLRTAVIANIFGNTTEDYIVVVRRLEEGAGLAAYELNLSCPNTERGGMEFGSDAAMVEEVTALVKKSSRRQVWVKLTPNVGDIVPLAKAAEFGGADAISLVNTFVGIQVRIGSGQRILPNRKGGLSGPAIRPLALRLVEQAARAVRIPVVGIGGVVCGADAAEFLRAGAAAVQIGTANFYDPKATVRIARELKDYCTRNGILSTNHLTGG